MKPLISNQHGAIVMALLPFLYGVALSRPLWQHIFLLSAWFFLYLATYPLLKLCQRQYKPLYFRWSAIYLGVALLLVLPALYYNPHIVFFAAAMLPLAAVNAYFSRRKEERALCNDLAAIAIFSLAGAAAYYFADSSSDVRIWQVGFYPALFFIGTTLYVKSVLRERKNPRYLKASLIFHLLCVLLFIFMQQYLLAAAFFPALVRALWLPGKKLSVRQIGLIEMGNSLVFFILLLYAA
ncbi:YwiC-like family protein [Mesocricetibacter intestinalis]|uniref:YwiC-like family protein n=1 Tax=Mesocricetibacter intestinalis TaxID=1521930 RepID=UPI00105EE339|nr:YwiC-like family protein [Mesocricetibacter intestinalis]